MNPTGELVVGMTLAVGSAVFITLSALGGLAIAAGGSRSNAPVVPSGVVAGAVAAVVAAYFIGWASAHRNGGCR